MKLVDGWFFPDGEAHLPDWMANPKNRVVLNGRAAYQGKKQEAALALCKSRRVMVDVGGHIGLWSFNFGKWFDVVHAYEPVEAHRKCFERNVKDLNVTLHAMALGEIPGMVSIHTAPTSSGDSWVDGAGNIPMETLDGQNLEDVDLIKLDCEGYELFALRGGVETIRRCKPVICVEQKPGKAQQFGLPETGAVDWLKRTVGYKLVQEIGGDFFMVPA